MVNEIPPFYPDLALLKWGVVVVVCSVVALIVGTVASFAAYGSAGPRVVGQSVSRGFRDLFLLSGKRIGAIALLTFKEAQRRRAFMICVLFLLLFMFAGWFLGESDIEKPAKAYISFVLTVMNFLLILMSLLIACWGLPADIKARSLHTVVTKPVRRSEIVLGRMFGNIGVITLVLLGTAILGYFWIQRKVPSYAQDQLIARVPYYGSLEFLDRNGNPAQKGINVGDLWDYRSFIEGGNQSRAIWKFENLDVASLKKAGKIRLEQKFEAFRTFKGDVNQQLHYSLTLVNPETNLRVFVDNYPVQEFADEAEVAVVEIPEELTYQDSYDLSADVKVVNLFDDLIHDGTLLVEVGAIEQQQYIGMAQADMFVRLPDRSFLSSYVKSCVCLWLMLTLVILIGTTGSCFLKGPVATIFTGGLILVGYVFRDQLTTMLTDQRGEEGVLGGGPVESLYRLVSQMNMTNPLPDNMGTDLIKGIDNGIFGLLNVASALIPNLQYFNTSQYTANGFDVSWSGALLPSLMITLGYFIPLVILGYFSLQLRELEHK